MTDLNKVFLIGRVTAGIDAVQGGFGYLNNETAIAKVSIAVNRSRKQGDKWVDEASFFNITIWGKTAENLKQYLKKGQLIAVLGFLKQDRWKDQQGNNRSSISIVAEQVELCGHNGNGGNNSNNANSGYAQNQNYGGNNAQNVPQPQQGEFGYQEDIPF